MSYIDSEAWVEALQLRPPGSEGIQGPEIRVPDSTVESSPAAAESNDSSAAESDEWTPATME